jgi:hypothetical protein
VAEALDAVPAQHPVEVVQAERVAPAALTAPEPERSKELEPQRRGGVPFVPDVTNAANAAVRFIRPFVPPVVTDAVDGVAKLVTKPLRQVFEETEEINFTLRRTHRVTVETEGPPPQPLEAERGWADGSGTRIESRRAEAIDESDGFSEIGGDADGAGEPGGPRQLPPA